VIKFTFTNLLIDSNIHRDNLEFYFELRHLENQVTGEFYDE